MKLSKDQEKDLANWVRIQEALGYPPTHKQIEILVSRMLYAQGEQGNRFLLAKTG